MSLVNEDTAVQYRRLIYSAGRPDILGSRFERRYPTSGTHLYCARIRGARPIYVRLGGETNPFIRMKAGDTLVRDFNDITIKTPMPAVGVNPYLVTPTDAVFFVSYGQFVIPAAPQNGFGAHGIAWTGLADTSPRNPMATLGVNPPPGGLLNGGPLTVGSIGGTLIIKNTDGTATLFVSWTWGDTLGAADTWAPTVANAFPILPGESLTLELAQPLMRVNSATNTGAGLLTDYDGLVVLTDAVAGCTFAAMASLYEIDRADPFDSIVGSGLSSIAGEFA